MVKAAVDNGDEHTFQLGLARVLQATKECMDMTGAANNATAYCDNNVLPLPPADRVGTRSARAKSDGTNHSRLNNASSSSSSTTKKKTGRKKKQNTTQQQECAKCQLLVHIHKHSLNTQHSLETCPNQNIFDQYFMNGGKSEDGRQAAV